MNNLKSMTGLALLSLSTATFAQQSMTLHTFAEGSILDHVSFVFNGETTNEVYRGSLPGSMEVSNNGDVIYFSDDQDGINTKVWKLSDNQVYSVPNLSGFPKIGSMPNITADGKMVQAYTELLRWNGNGFEGIPEWRTDDSSGTILNSTGTLYVEACGSIPGKADFLKYTGYQSYAGRTGRCFISGSDEQPNKYFYWETWPVDVDPTGQNILVRTQQEPEGSSLFYPNYDLSIVDIHGRYVSEPFNAVYGVALADDSKSILAFTEDANCPSTPDRVEGFCGVIWNKDNGLNYLGNFRPTAMSGDAELVVGLTAHDDLPNFSNPNDLPVIWDPVNGEQSFIDVVSTAGADLSTWTDVKPIAVSKDGSKIVGHGLQSNGVRSAFLISIPANTQKNWNGVSVTDAAIQKIGNWNIVSDSNVSSGSVASSSEKTEILKYTFTGDYVRINGIRGAANGVVDVIIDGGSYGRVDTFSCSIPSEDVLFESFYLSPGEHTLELVVSGASNKASLGKTIAITSIESRSSDLPVYTQSGTAVSEPVFNRLDLDFNLYNQSNPNLQSCGPWFGCSDSYDSWSAYLWDASEQSAPMSEIVAADGAFGTEMWIRQGDFFPRANYGPLLEIDSDGKYFLLSLTDNNELEYKTQTGTSLIGTPLSQEENEWDHIVVTGNWYNGQVSIYINGIFAAEVAALDVDGAQHGKMVLARATLDPLPVNDGIGKIAWVGDMAKFSAYNETLTEQTVELLFEYPLGYGLSFAPAGSPEYTVQLPGCSQGCQPGADINALPAFGGQIGSGGIPSGGFGGGGF